MKTYSPKARELQPQWHVVDATDKVLGKLAADISILLMGKHKPTYSPHMPVGDFVIVINAAKVRVTGKKEEQKSYIHSTLYPGGLREISLKKQRQTHPDRIIEHAVWGMLPKTKLGKTLMGRLKVYAGAEHPHQAQLAGKTPDDFQPRMHQ